MATSPAKSKDSHVKKTSHPKPSLLTGLRQSALGVGLGVLLCFASFFLLFCNEGQAAKMAAALEEGRATVLPLSRLDAPSQANEGGLVHISGPLSTQQVLHDPNYDVKVYAVKLKRQVEMFQWVEHEDSSTSEDDTHTRYTYSTEWRPDVVNSRNFDREIGHENPSIMAVESKVATSPAARVGSFFLSPDLLEKIDWFEPLTFDGVPPATDGVIVTDAYHYHSSNPHNPLVGDLRVSFLFAGKSGNNAEQVSVVARQAESELQPYRTKSGHMLALLSRGMVSAQVMLEKEQKNLVMYAWAMRVIGWLLMYLGLSLMTRPLQSLVSWVPFVRECMNVGLSLFCGALSLSISLLVVALAWLVFHPLITVLLISLALLPLWFCYWYRPAGPPTPREDAKKNY
uniref:Transmembrane protein 43 n=1 Tax=Eptatretus burgeri TaxID=7764 RepID=A0A8C4QFT1_EPTBU